MNNKTEKTKPDSQGKISKARSWLEMNKIFFETIAATLLSVMAIIVSVQQTSLSRIQTKISQRQLEREERLAKVQRTTKWGELRDAMWDILDILGHPRGTAHMVQSLTPEQRIALAQRIRRILESQNDNARLLENDTCLGYWRNAIASTRMIPKMQEMMTNTQNDETVTMFFISIFEDVINVWKELVLGSGEVSAPGDKPKKKE